MNVRTSLLILCMITAIILSLNPLPAISQWDAPSSTININMEPYFQTTSNISNPFFRGKRTPFFDPWTSSFPFGFNSRFGAWTDRNNSDNDKSKGAPDVTEFYPIEYLGHEEAITNGHLVTCSGQLFGNLNENIQISIYDLQIIDITDPPEYKKIGELQFESESGLFGPGEVKKLIVEENLAYILINDPAGFYITNLEDCNAPELIHYQDLHFTDVQDMEIKNDWAFIAFNDYNSIISSWNISNPQDISSFDNIGLNGWIKDLYIDHEILLAIGDSYSGLNIIDISDPIEMNLHCHLDLCGEAVRMMRGVILTAGGDHDWISRLRVLDYKNLVDPIQVGSLNLPGREQMVCSEGNMIYVLSASIYMHQSQISTFLMDEETLQLEPLKVINIDGICHNLEIYQSFLMATQENQVLLWDITDPTEPKILDPFRIDTSHTLDYLNDYVWEEKEETESFVYMDTGWPFGPFFNFFNNPLSSPYTWSSPPAYFFMPGSNLDRDFYQGPSNGLNRYSFSYNNWQFNPYPPDSQWPSVNSPEYAPWKGFPLFDFITGLVQTGLNDLELLFLYED